MTIEGEAGTAGWMLEVRRSGSALLSPRSLDGVVRGKEISPGHALLMAGTEAKGEWESAVGS